MLDVDRKNRHSLMQRRQIDVYRVNRLDIAICTIKISTMPVDTEEVTAIKTVLTRSDTVLKLSFSQCWLYHWQICNLNKVPDRSHSLTQRWNLSWTWMLLRSRCCHNKESSSFLSCRWRFSLSLSFSLSLHRPSICLNFSRFRDLSRASGPI